MSFEKKRKNQIILIMICLYFLLFIFIKYYLKQPKLTTDKDEEEFKDTKIKTKKYPKYFQKFIKTRKIDDLMNNYLDFHTKSIQEINSNCNSFFKKKFVIFKPHYYSGFGNIIMGLIPTILYALLSNRIILLQWNEEKREGCKASYNDLFISKFKWNIENDILNSCPNLREHFDMRLFHLEFTPAQNPNSYKFFKCSSNFQIQSKEKHIIEIEAAQYYLPLFYENIFYKRELKTLFKNSFFSKIQKYIIEPRELNKIQKMKNEIFPKNHFILGVHIRKNLREYLFHQTPLNIFWNCIDERIKKFEIENKKKKKYSGISIFISSDFQPAKLEAKKRYGDKLIHLHSNEISREKNSVIFGLYNLWLLSYSNDLIVTEKSTFSHISYSLNNLKPLEVKYREGQFLNNPKCIREYSSEPKFHLYFRSNDIHC
eukprot:gene7717-12187_t